MRLCFFVTSFNSRAHLIKEFAWRFKDSPLDYPLFIFCDGSPAFPLPNGVEWKEDNWSFQYCHIPAAITYRTLLRLACRIMKRSRPYNNNLLGYTPLWGRRLKAAVHELRNQGFTHAVWSCDDGWYENVSKERFVYILKQVEQLNPGCFRLSESLTQKQSSIPYKVLSNDVVELLPSSNSLPCHFITHQTTLWNLDVLDAITKKYDCACRHENSGAYRFKRGGWRAMEYEGSPVVPSLGVYGDHSFRSGQANF